MVLILSILYSLGLTLGFGVVDFYSGGKRIEQRLFGLLLVIPATILVWSGQLPYWFSMTTLFPENASFLVRYNVEISFWMGLLGIILTIVFAMKPWSKRSE